MANTVMKARAHGELTAGVNFYRNIGVKHTVSKGIVVKTTSIDTNM